MTHLPNDVAADQMEKWEDQPRNWTDRNAMAEDIEDDNSADEDFEIEHEENNK